VVKYSKYLLEATSNARRPKLYVVRSKSALEGALLRYSASWSCVHKKDRQACLAVFFCVVTAILL
jgi:hypothetical protein